MLGVGGVMICGVYAVAVGCGTGNAVFRTPTPKPAGAMGRRDEDTICCFVSWGTGMDSDALFGSVIGVTAFFLFCDLIIKYKPNNVITNATISEI